MVELVKVDEDIWEVPQSYKPDMKVPGRIFLSDKLIKDLEDGSIEQVANVATLPGIQKYAMAMPDAHIGYGFPIGGVAAFDLDTGVISPGGVGFDINCGVRLLKSDLKVEDIRKDADNLIERLYHNVPSGLGSESKLRVSDTVLNEVFEKGARWAVENGYGVKADLEHCEENGEMKGANFAKVSKKAHERGRSQLGTLGSGNHFLEIQYVEKIYDEQVAKAFGLEEGKVTVMIHCGSRGAGHQICTDYIKVLEKASRKYGIKLYDRQLACAPLSSEEAKDYISAMAAAANYAWANRQVISHWVRETFNDYYKSEIKMDLLYDVAHNVAKFEEHDINGKRVKVCVHRKGATRAFAPGREEVPVAFRNVGQPVIIPGSMGSASYVLVGTQKAMETTFGSTCHGAGRVMSRHAAKKEVRGSEIKKELLEMGIIVKAPKDSAIAEEAPEVYKDIDDVIEVVHRLGISKKVARLVPIAVAKG
ncbi:RNA-splicing ligase RtcB [Methanocella sp. CWC-04]|uniref:tRNA-splicing ligase RtcB n=1 Tax=Methanooceanicella nereidis TaxID=2052831 RepID=A0AAP2RAV1_9EURY|nr:RtcB family protein [Methanocella sp. CWC-04]MCD1293973.1 RNA-splicing ligase RtcB [Methanocella sp. CWC-04]